MASDSRVVYEEDYKGERVERVRKLFPLGKNAFIVTTGAGYGVQASLALSDMFRNVGDMALDKIVDISMDYINEGYAKFMKEAKEWFERHPNAYTFLYVTIGGFCPVTGKIYFKLFASEYHQLPLKEVQHQGLICFPRRMFLEARLMGAMDWELEKVAGFIKKRLEAIEKEDDRIASPFQIGVVDEQGFRILPI